MRTIGIAAMWATCYALIFLLWLLRAPVGKNWLNDDL